MKEYLDRRIWHKEHGVSYWCSICGEYKPESDFYKSKRTKWGVDRNCKEHYRLGKEDRETAYLQFNNFKKSDFVNALALLQSLGYDTSKNVHEQFMERYKDKINKN